MKEKIGRANAATSDSRYPINRIELPNLSEEGIFPKASQLYESGSSLRDIAKELQITRHMARKVLLSHSIGLRRSNRGLKRPDSKTAGRYIGTAPYGYFIQQGKLVEDNREQQTIQLIMKLRSMGKSQAAIARYLNDHKIRTRRSKNGITRLSGILSIRHALGENNTFFA